MVADLDNNFCDDGNCFSDEFDNLGIMKKTKFQCDFKRKDAFEIVKLWHPELPIEKIESCLKFGPGAYCWNQIQFNIAGYGKVALGISNYNNHTLYGRVSKERMIEAMNSGEIGFHVWRFSLDKLADNEKYGSPERTELEKKSADYLSKHYSIMSIDEFYNQYYED